MDEARTDGQKWLANELNLYFLILKKCTKGQSNRSILSKVIVLTDDGSTTHKLTDAFAKIIFSHLGGGGGSKREDLMKILSHFAYKTNSSSDENIKKWKRVKEIFFLPKD